MGWLEFRQQGLRVEATGDQRRSEFVNSRYAAIADGDEWDDQLYAEGYLDTFMSTAAIDVSSASARTLELSLTHHGVEYDSNYRQTANITVSFDGGAPIEVLRNLIQKARTFMIMLPTSTLWCLWPIQTELKAWW